jgi:ribosomal protein L12E/L44/L45/RPP1/RPP2
MAKKTRKVLKQESHQRAMQQAMTNVNTAHAAAPAATAPTAAARAAVATAPVAARAAKTEYNEEQSFAFVKSDVRRSLTLATVFAVIMIALSFVVH